MLIDEHSQTSFYETFSDLIFGTLVVFLVILVTIILKVGESEEQQQAAQQYDEELLEYEISRLKQDLDAERDRREAQLSEAQRRLAAAAKSFEHELAEKDALAARQRQLASQALSAAREGAASAAAAHERAQQAVASAKQELERIREGLSGGPCHVIVAIDRSASMAEPIRRLTNSLRYLAEVMPRISEEFRVTIIAYRENVPSQNVFDDVIANPGEDAALMRFARERLIAQNGLVDLEKAVDEALRAARRGGVSGTRRVICIVSDVGLTEIDEARGGAGGHLPSTHETAIGRRIKARLLNWIGASPDHRLAVVQCDPTENPFDQAAAAYYSDLVGSAGPKGIYETSSRALNDALVYSIID